MESEKEDRKVEKEAAKLRERRLEK